MPDLTELAAEIERLDAGATEGPWRPEAGAYAVHQGDEAENTWGRWLSIADTAGLHISHMSYGSHEQREANAALIALLRNNAATIVSALRAASRVERVEAALKVALDEAEAVSSQVVCIGMMSDAELEMAATSWAELPERIRRALDPAP